MKPEETRDSQSSTLESLVVGLRKERDAAIRRSDRAEQRAAEIAAAQVKSERARLSAEQELASLRGELAAAEARLTEAIAQPDDANSGLDLAGITVLYVGGRPQQVARMREIVEQSSARFLHHDGGVEERADLLPGLVSRADAAFMPVDCVSHAAAQSLKRLCRHAGKPFVPLRSSGIASLLHALRSREFDGGRRKPPTP